MKRLLPTVQLLLVCLLFLLISHNSVYAQCPEADTVLKGLVKFVAKGVKVIDVQPSVYPEICEVHVRLRNRSRIIYVGSRGDFFMLGQLYDAVSGRNLTRNALEKITRFSSEEMHRLNELTAFSIGSSDKKLYFITDPKCPYCKKGAEILKKLITAEKIQVNFLLFPLASHKGAKEQAISVVCDGKSLSDFESGYRSGNQCSDGIKKIESTVSFLQGKGIGGTPTYIFPDGRFHSGLLKEGELRSRLGLMNSREK